MFIQVEPVRASVLDVLVCCVDMVLNTEWVQIEAIDLTNDGTGWGFGITGGRSTGVVVKTVVPGSAADKDGRLQIGDHIIQIGDINLRGMGSEQVAMVLRQSGSQVHLIVARPVEPTSPDDNIIQSSAPIVPTRILSEPEELEQQLNLYQQGQNGFSEQIFQQENLYDGEHITLCSPSDLGPKLQKDQPIFRGKNDKMDMESFEINLIKDHQGLGIIVAGYVCEREDISGIFVKSISKGSVADICGQIRVHDQVVEVDGHPLKGYSNCEAVEILRNTGKHVKLRLARYQHGAKFEHLQEAMANGDLCLSTSERPLHSDFQRSVSPGKISCIESTNFGRNTSSLLNTTSKSSLKAKWETILGSQYEIIISELRKKEYETTFGFGIEGTSELEDSGLILYRHFIRDIWKGYSMERNSSLFIGDELLEVNGRQLRGLKGAEVLAVFKSLPQDIILVCARSHHKNSNISLVPWNERLIRAKSDGYLICSKHFLNNAHSPSRKVGGSLETFSSLATWNSEPHFIDLIKGDKGLGFSIVEYKDSVLPHALEENVIVVWSLVPGAAAQLDGRLLPGDRLLSVNSINLRYTSLDTAVQVLKHIPKGVVRLGIAKPIAVSRSISAQISSEVKLENKPSYITNGNAVCIQESNEVMHVFEESHMYTRSQTPSSIISFGNDSQLSTPLSSPAYSRSAHYWGFDIPLLPTALERIVKIKKGTNKLGLILDMADKGQNGMIVKSVRPASAIERDGNVQVGDYILSLNYENMRNITRSQARAINRRAELTSTDIVIKYIPAGDAAVHQQSAVLAKIHEGRVSPSPSIISRQPSPRIFPKYYRSPYFPHKNLKNPADGDQDNDGQISPFSFLSEDASTVPTPSSFYTDNEGFDSSSDDVLLDIYDTNLEETSSMKENETTDVIFPSIEERISLFQGNCVKQQVPSKFTKMSASPTVSPVPDESPQQPTSPVIPQVEPIKATPADATTEQTITDAPVQQVTNNSTIEEVPSEATVQQITTDSIVEQIVTDETLQMITDPTTKQIPAEPSAEQITTDPTVHQTARETNIQLPLASPALARSTFNSPKISSPGCQWGMQRTVHLCREPGQEIGIGIVMGCIDVVHADPLETVSGIFIKNIVPNSPAGRNGSLNRGDRIIEVNGSDLQTASYAEAIDVIRNSGCDITFVVQSLVPWVLPSDNLNAAQNLSPQFLHDGVANAEAEAISAVSMATKQASLSDDEEDFEAETDFQGKVYSAKGVEIDRSSAGFVKLTPEEKELEPEEDEYGYTHRKVQKKYGELKGIAILVEIEKGLHGLGLSLAGNKNRSKMSVFVCGLHPRGNAAKTGQIQTGDELLEVNGIVLYGRCHLNASAVIRGMATPSCKIILLRKENAIEEMAVKPISHFPFDMEDEDIDSLFISYPGIRTITTKKGNHGLGIMILEGKHVDMGQGIFVSDIQKESPADQAGLAVGDMILAVNKTKLVGSSYETAASVLKHAEGPVTFLVINTTKPSVPASPLANSIPQEKASKEMSSEKAHELHPESKEDESFPPVSLPPPSPMNSVVPLPVCPLPPPAEFSDSAANSEQQGSEMLIEIHKGHSGLGLSVVGGSDTPLNSIVIHEVYPEGAVSADGRLRPGDQILEVNGKNLREATHGQAVETLRQSVPVIQLLVYRASNENKECYDVSTLEVDLYKKAGKGLGLSIVGRRNGPGVFISEVVRGGVAESDGRLMQGDQILEVNGQDLRNATQEFAAALLKTTVGKIGMKIGRLKAEPYLSSTRSNATRTS